MAKRGNGEGSIRKKVTNGRTSWEARYTGPDGKQHSLYGKTRSEAATRLSAVLRDLGKGLPPPPERQTVRDYLARWLIAIKPSLEPGTWLRYEQYVRLHIVPTLGRTQLAALTPQQLSQLYAVKLETRSAQTVHHLHACIHKALEDALRQGLVARNVAELVTPPKVKRREMRVLLPAEAVRLLDGVRGTRWEGLYAVALSTGMRQGELLGLRWSDVDLEAGHLRLQTSLKNVNGKRWLGRPKTESSRRKLILTRTAIEALRRQRARQAEDRLRAGPIWTDTGLVFTAESGREIAGSNLWMSHQRTMRRLGLPADVRFHDLRHTAATLLLLDGQPVKVVSEMLGHASVNITMNLYMHVLPDMQRRAAEAMDRLLGGAVREDEDTPGKGER